MAFGLATIGLYLSFYQGQSEQLQDEICLLVGIDGFGLLLLR